MINLMLSSVVRSLTLWSMKTAYKGATPTQKQQIRAYAATKSLIIYEREVADLYWEFYNWITNYENKP